jgi:hypothetical protein
VRTLRELACQDCRFSSEFSKNRVNKCVFYTYLEKLSYVATEALVYTAPSLTQCTQPATRQRGRVRPCYDRG